MGAPSKMVTNRHRDGRPASIHILLRRHLGLDPSNAEEVKRRLKHFAIETAKAMAKGSPSCPEYGIDIGVDSARIPEASQTQPSVGG
ncbi:YheC/YheD family protein [Melghirimyces thermohalophilus]|uniref:YheC/YheD family protein n=1 Tax=Melghirimyces thermohalophilus TaxID=1236220 RepID=UPI00316AD5D4